MIGRGAGGYVNLLSHSPVDTPCPGYRYREFPDNAALLDDTAAPLVAATTPPAVICGLERRADVLCPVQIHVHDPNPVVRERRRVNEKVESDRKQRADKNDPRRWIDLDDNVLDGYILIDDKYAGPAYSGTDEEGMPFPEGAEEVDEDDEDDADTDSHGKYDSFMYYRKRKESARRIDLEPTMYPLANSHGNAYQDSSSHNKYSELFSENSRTELDIPRDDDGACYSLANSHEDYSGISSENRDRSFMDNLDNDRLMWDTRYTANYEVANSHSNYRVFYDSQTQQGLVQAPMWPTESWGEHMFSNYAKEDQKQEDVAKLDTQKGPGTKSRNEADPDTTCDIEQCLVQIEESLLNIEQNLLHVQDLDIPQLRNLLYKSPSIERSLFEVQDLLYADGIVPVIARSKPASLDSDEEEEDEDDEDEEEGDVWIGRNRSIKDNDDEDGDAAAGPFGASNEESSDTANQDDSAVKSTDDRTMNSDWGDGNASSLRASNFSFQADPEKAVNFIPNSLGKTPPRRVILEETKENIRLCSSEPEEPPDGVDYNLNTACAEKKFFFRDKCHSRTNSLDENSTFQNSEFGDRHGNGKTSLQNLSFEATNNSFDANGKAKSESTLQTQKEKSSKPVKENRSTTVEEKSERFRRKAETNVSHRRSTMGSDFCRKPTRMSKELLESALPKSRDRSPSRQKRNASSDKEKDGGKVNCDKRKRKKASSRAQAPNDNALVPSKLISLSLSLLLAALLQAVRCLTDLVEDAFRSVSYDRNGLLQ